MSTKYRVEFKEVIDAHRLSDAIRREIELLIELLFSNVDWEKDPLDFVFRKASAYAFPETKPFNYNAIQIYRTMIGVRRKLSGNENRLCMHLQSMIDQCDNCQQVRKAFGTLFEKYIYQRELKRKNDLFYNCHLYVEGEKIQNEGRDSIDIGYDQLDNKEILEMSECAISIRTFEKKDHAQYDFYLLAFERIRALAKTAKLQFNLIAACCGGRKNWDNVIINEIKRKQNSINIRPECLLDIGVEDEWNN